MEDKFSMDRVSRGWLQDDSNTLCLLCILFLLLLYQLHLRSSGIRSWRLGTPGLSLWVHSGSQTRLKGYHCLDHTERSWPSWDPSLIKTTTSREKTPGDPDSPACRLWENNDIMIVWVFSTWDFFYPRLILMSLFRYKKDKTDPPGISACHVGFPHSSGNFGYIWGKISRRTCEETNYHG